LRSLSSPDVILFDQRICVGQDLILPDDAIVLESRLPVSLQDQIVRQIVIENQAIFVAIFRDMLMPSRERWRMLARVIS